MNFYKLKISFGVLYFLLPSLAAAQSGGYILHGKAGMPLQGTAYLSNPVGTSDSAIIKNGVFTFKGSIKEPQLIRLFLAKTGQRYEMQYIPSIQLYLEPGIISFTSPDSLAHAEISGTPRNVVNNKLNHIFRPFQEREISLKNALYGATTAQRQDTARTRRLVRELAAIEAEQQVIIRKFIQQNPASPVSLDALIEPGGRLFAQAEREALFNGLSAPVRNSPPGQRYALQLARVRARVVGALAPDFTQNDVNGKPVSLRDFRGRYVLLDFWASWCSPCRADNPGLVAVYNGYKERNFTVLGVSLDQARTWWLKAIADDHLTWTQVSDLNYWKNEAAQLYAIESVPQNFLIGPDGRIIAKDLTPQELSDKLGSVLPKKKP